MSRIIINNKSSLSDKEAVEIVSRHIGKGLISTGTYGKQYCHLITYGDNENHISHVSSCDKRKSGSYSFTISNYNTKEKSCTK